MHLKSRDMGHLLYVYRYIPALWFVYRVLVKWFLKYYSQLYYQYDNGLKKGEDLWWFPADSKLHWYASDINDQIPGFWLLGGHEYY